MFAIAGGILLSLAFLFVACYVGAFIFACAESLDNAAARRKKARDEFLASPAWLNSPAYRKQAAAAARCKRDGEAIRRRLGY